MLFNSLHFIIFFPIVCALYFATPHRHRWVLLLIASYYFYMSWKMIYALLILGSTVVDYFTGRAMGTTERPGKKKLILMASLLCNLGLLFFFKYYNFFSSSMNGLFSSLGSDSSLPAINVLLPVGISFYTFQTLSYTIDVYRGDKAPEHHPGVFAVYVSFFPQLVAGPIERSTRLLPQLTTRMYFDHDRVVSGLRLMLWGFFKKMVIADNAAIYVNAIYNDAASYQGFPLIIATYLFAFQIYCDFSAYSDIAIGASRILGIDLMENFRQPYFSRSIGEFWKRWHISLSTWFRDYVYIPLGGNRVPRWRNQANLMITFMVSGLWHGANWTFVVWGGLHGMYLIIGQVTQPLRDSLAEATGLSRLPILRNLIKTFIVFHLAVIAWIFFRARSLTDAWYILTHIAPTHLGSVFSVPGISWLSLSKLFLAIGVMEGIQWFLRRRDLDEILMTRSEVFRWLFYLFLLTQIIFLGRFGEQEFIYFQF